MSALEEWDGTGEPEGWMCHPRTGRRRPNGDPNQEYCEPMTKALPCIGFYNGCTCGPCHVLYISRYANSCTYAKGKPHPKVLVLRDKK